MRSHGRGSNPYTPTAALHPNSGPTSKSPWRVRKAAVYSYAIFMAMHFLYIYFWRNIIHDLPHPQLSSTHHSLQLQNETCHPHVVFTTLMCPSPNCTPLRERIENNTRHVWSSMDRVEFKVFSSTSVKTNQYGMPLIGDMYTRMFEACPDALSYTYLNGDIISTRDSFVGTLDALFVGTATKIGDFLLVGRRTNVPWSETYDATREDFDFKAHFDSGELFVPKAQDYFTVTKGAINWTDIPPFVVGRAGYDNWIVEECGWANPKVSFVDGTQTAHVIHQTDSNGAFAHGGVVEEEEDRLYNLHYAMFGNPRRKFAHGHTGNADWETVHGNGTEQGLIFVRHKDPEHAFVW